MRFIVRVDDVGQAQDQSQVDRGMELFARWYEPWRGLPLYCGIVPAALGDAEWKWIRDNIPTRFQAIHGWDHADQSLTLDHVRLALQWTPTARVVIPPYNRYNDGNFVKSLPDLMPNRTPVILGGFHWEDHRLGVMPVMFGGTLHISAEKLLYDRCYILAEKLRHFLLPIYMTDVENADESVPIDVMLLLKKQYPLQIVLHHRWDTGAMNGVRRLAKLIGPHMVSLEDCGL